VDAAPVNIPQIGQADGQFMADAVTEMDALISEGVIIKRWTSTTKGNSALLQGDTQNYTSIPAVAVVEELTPLEIASSGNVYAAGDIRIQVALQIFGGENASGGDGAAAPRPADWILRDGRPYRIVGHPYQVKFGQGSWWKAVIRQSAG
jgi:hypothetical protein